MDGCQVSSDVKKRPKSVIVLSLFLFYPPVESGLKTRPFKNKTNVKTLSSSVVSFGDCCVQPTDVQETQTLDLHMLLVATFDSVGSCRVQEENCLLLRPRHEAALREKTKRKSRVRPSVLEFFRRSVQRSRNEGTVLVPHK